MEMSGKLFKHASETVNDVEKRLLEKRMSTLGERMEPKANIQQEQVVSWKHMFVNGEGNMDNDRSN